MEEGRREEEERRTSKFEEEKKRMMKEEEKTSDPCSVSFGCLLSKRCGGEVDNILHLHS